MAERRYAAQAIPRHTAVGLLGVDCNGNFQTDVAEGRRAELCTQLFTNLLCDKGFIKARAELLGRNRSSDAGSTLTSDGSDDKGTQLILKEARENDRNMLFSTRRHMKDIDWCATFCFSDHKKADNQQADQQKEVAEAGSKISHCLDAISRWEEELIASYRLLHDSGRLTICDETANESKVASLSNHLADLLMSNYGEASDGESPVAGESCVEVTKTLLAKKDAWTMKDNSAQVFKEDSSTEITSPKPPRKGRRKKRAEQKEESQALTSLARVLGINIYDLRMSVSVGRSLLFLNEFAQSVRDKEIFSKEAKESRSIVHGIQCSCLKNAIEILSCAATTLGYILCSSLEKLDEDDLDETVMTSLGPAVLLQKFGECCSITFLITFDMFHLMHLYSDFVAITREASKPLLSVAGILSADAWFSLGNLVNKAYKLDSNEHVMLCSLERALLILNAPRSMSLNKPNLDLMCESLLSPLTQYKWSERL